MNIENRYSIAVLVCILTIPGTLITQLKDERTGCCLWGNRVLSEKSKQEKYSKQLFTLFEKREKISTDQLIKNITLCIQKGADINSEDGLQRTFLHRILKINAEMNQWRDGSERSVVVDRSQRLLTLLIASNVNVNKRSREILYNSFVTPLHAAITIGEESSLFVAPLLKADANVHAQEPFRMDTPLLMAVRLLTVHGTKYCSYETVRLLLEYGALPQASNIHEEHALDLVEKSNDDALKMLFKVCGRHEIRRPLNVSRNLDESDQEIESYLQECELHEESCEHRGN